MSQDQATQLLCPQCGAANQSGAKFCVKCGAPLKPETEPLSLEERIAKLQACVDEMMTSLKSYTLQQVQLCMLAGLNKDNVNPSLLAMGALVKAQLTDKNKGWSERFKHAKQHAGFLWHMKSVNEFNLPDALAEYEVQKISNIGSIGWIGLRNQYHDLCGELKSLDKFDEDDDAIDFDEVFAVPLEQACQEAKATGKRIIKDMTSNSKLYDVTWHSTHQMRVLDRLSSFLYNIQQRLCE